MIKHTLIIGASTNTERYSNIAITKLQLYNITVTCIGAKVATTHGQPILTGMPDLHNVHTITLYINPKAQEAYYRYILSLKPTRLIFNPGTENPILYKMAKAQHINCLNACTLVLLTTYQY